MKETDSAINTPRAGPSGFPTALRALGKVKMGDLTRKLKKEVRKDSVKSDVTPSSTTSSTPGGASGSLPKTKEPASPSSSRKTSPFSTKKDPKKTGLQAFKMKGLIGTKKKQQETPSPVESGGNTNRELKHRIFFIERKELTDDEVFSNIGNEVIPKVTNPGLNDIVQAASFMKKFMKEKETDKETKKDGLSNGMPPSLLHVGRLRSRLADNLKKEIPKDGEVVPIVNNVLLGSTKFMGKMTYSKDKHGLFVGPTDPALDDNDQQIKEVKENPIFLALEKVKLKPQTSFDSSGHSRVASRASPGSQKSNATLGDSEKEKKMGEGGVVGVLQDGLSTVRPADIPEWNMHKHVRDDRELKPIFVPF